MITASKIFITNGGTETIWSQPSQQVTKKIRDCLRLKDEYQACFQRTKKALEEAKEERKFEFSETYIFGKFDTFARRVNRILDMFSTIDVYGKLSDAKIEGVH